MFASHYHNIWITGGPAPLADCPTYNDRPDIGNTTAGITSFNKGADLADWLVNVDCIFDAREAAAPTPHRTRSRNINTNVACAWLTVPRSNNIRYLSFDTPIGGTRRRSSAAAWCSPMSMSHPAMSPSTTKPFPERLHHDIALAAGGRPHLLPHLTSSKLPGW